jgi:solute carrier family 25 phosphate transporter 3
MALNTKTFQQGFKVSIAEEGVRGLAKGWAPTLIGYSIQGLGKFGFYEAFKHFYSGILGEVFFLEKTYIEIVLKILIIKLFY